jgi:hypothetical protein
VIELGDDVLTGDSFQVGPAAGPDVPVDVDGESFSSVFAGTVTGDAVAPSTESVIQDRGIDPSGLTYDVTPLRADRRGRGRESRQLVGDGRGERAQRHPAA